jgi:flagellar basal-body rod protein FlgC
MSAITSPSQIALTGVRAATAVIANSAHDTANINTAGYRPGRTTLEDTGAGVRAVVQTGGVPEGAKPTDHSEVSLVEETVDQIAASALYAANLAVIRAEDERLGTLLDTKR